MLVDSIHVTRVFEFLPAGDQRERVREFLIDEYPDEGATAKFNDIQTVADLRALGRKTLVERGMAEIDAAWLLSQIGGAKRGRKPKGD